MVGRLTWAPAWPLVLLSCGCASVKPASSPVDAGAGAETAPAVADASATTEAAAPVDRIAVSTERPPPATGQVYAHSADTLYLLEPISKRVTIVGTFDCVGSMVDIAIDAAGKMTGSAAVAQGDALGGALVSIDPRTAHCQILTRGDNLITSLTYVPAGTLLPGREALVGYDEDRYLQIDPATGALTQIGTLNGPASGGTEWVSSGDIVSIVNGGTYLTVLPRTGPEPGGDRIVEVDPKTGLLKRIIGPTGQDDVLGLGYWGGVAYGFTLSGHLIQIDLTSGAGSDIPIPALEDAGTLSFLGAGTTTIAPVIVE